MNTRYLGRLGLGLLLGATVLLGAGQGWAQSVNTGTVTATITMPDGAPAAGATVVLSGPALVRGQWDRVADREGRVVFLSVPPGTYEVTASLVGFNTAHVDRVVLSSAQTIPLALQLEIAAAEGEIIVTSQSPVVDTRASDLNKTFDNAVLDVVPTQRDSFYDLSLTAPGMTNVGADESWLPSPSAYGSSATDNIFLVNGVNTTNPRGAAWGSLVNVNYDAVDEVTVLSLGSRAEYGSFSGAAIDVLTKSGGNEFHGTVGYYTMLGSASDNSTTSYGADWLWADPDDELTTVPETNDEIAVTIGGPILRDKLWFFFGYDKQKRENNVPIFQLPKITERDIWDLKLTADFSANHRASLGFHYEDTELGNESWGDTWDDTMIYNQPSENTTLQFQYQWVASDRDIVTFKYLGFDTEQNPTIPNSTGHPGYINWWKWTGTQSIGLNGDFPYVEAQKSKRQTLQADYTHYAEDWAGEHEIKFGVQYTGANGDWQGGYFHGYANFAYPYPWDYGPAENWWWNCEEDWCWGTPEDPVFPMYVRKNEVNPWLTVRESDSIGGFIDDQWVVSDRVTLNLGIRYDQMSAKYGTGYVYEMPETPEDINNPTVLRQRAGTDDIYDFKTFSPRIGLAWTITDDAKTVLRAHLGRYYAPLGVESLRRFGPDMQPFNQDTWMYLLPMSEVDLNNNGVIDPDEVRPATRLLHDRDPDFLQASSVQDPSWDLEVDPSTTSPYTDQFILSVQRQLGRDYSLELTYIYKNTEDIIALKPYNSETGEYYEWESQPYTTWTGYETDVWQIRLEDYNGDGVTNVDDARFVVDNNNYRAVNVNEFNGKSVDRTYQGLQLALNKRYSDRWRLSASLNWTNTDGFVPRPVDQNWYIDGPLTMDTPFGSTNNHFQNNTEGPLLMTPEWMFKVFGNYKIPVVETDFGFRLRYDSGRAIFPIQSIPTFQTWMSDLQDGVYLGTNWHEMMVADDPNDPDWMPSTTIIDLNLQKSIKLGKGTDITIMLDLLNAFNEDAPNKVGYTEGDYGRVYSLVMPRMWRLGLRFGF